MKVGYAILGCCVVLVDEAHLQRQFYVWSILRNAMLDEGMRIISSLLVVSWWYSVTGATQHLFLLVKEYGEHWHWKASIPQLCPVRGGLSLVLQRAIPRNPKLAIAKAIGPGSDMTCLASIYARKKSPRNSRIIEYRKS